MSIVSVIVPVYKVEPYLRRCVDSILAQTFTDFDLVLVDDGSPDNCGAICDEYAAKDSRITVIHKQNGGLSDARNAGIDWAFSNSSSEWLTFIDSDDWVHPEYLSALLNAAKEYGAEIAVCDFCRVEKLTDFENIIRFDVSFPDIESFFIDHNTVATVAWAKVYRKKFFENVRYPIGKIHEDEFITYRLLFQNNNIAFVNHQLYYYFINSQSIMTSSWSEKELSSIEALSQQYDFFKKNKYKNAFVATVQKYIWFLRESYDIILVSDVPDKNQLIPHIKRELRKCLRRKGIDMPVRKNEKLYSIAFPGLMKIYYLKKRAIKKLKRIFNIKQG